MRPPDSSGAGDDGQVGKGGKHYEGRFRFPSLAEMPVLPTIFRRRPWQRRQSVRCDQAAATSEVAVFMESATRIGSIKPPFSSDRRQRPI